MVVARVSATLLAWVLADFAQGRLGKNRRAMVLDRAGWHVSGELRVPEGLLLSFLPAVSTELQPAERLWPLVDACIAHRYQDEDELWQRLERQCAYLRTRPELLQAHSHFHWWPATLPQMRRDQREVI